MDLLSHFLFIVIDEAHHIVFQPRIVLDFSENLFTTVSGSYDQKPLRPVRPPFARVKTLSVQFLQGCPETLSRKRDECRPCNHPSERR